MSSWDDYPLTYRAEVVGRILQATRAGESAAVVGLSGVGKSNLLGFLAHRAQHLGTSPDHRYRLVDCNRLPERTSAALFRHMRRAPSWSPATSSPSQDEFEALEVSLDAELIGPRRVTFMLDRFDDLAGDADRALFNQLRALRDRHKYALTYVIATRHPFDAHTELAELFYANTIWLGALDGADALWNVAQFAERRGLHWGGDVAAKLIEASHGYASLLRACAEAHAAGCSLDAASLSQHPSVKQRIDEFWADAPSDDEIRLSGLVNHPLLMRGRALRFDTTQLTAKEHALLTYLQSRSGQVCEKDDIIRAVWPEDKVIERGIRDDSLAQLVRRLREKVEPDAGAPRHVLTVPGRGYRFVT